MAQIDIDLMWALDTESHRGEYDEFDLAEAEANARALEEELADEWEAACRDQLDREARYYESGCTQHDGFYHN